MQTENPATPQSAQKWCESLGDTCSARIEEQKAPVCFVLLVVHQDYRGDDGSGRMMHLSTNLVTSDPESRAFLAWLLDCASKQTSSGDYARVGGPHG